MALARHHQPGLVLLDWPCRDSAGSRPCRSSVPWPPQARVVVLSSLDPAELAHVARLEGAAGYLCKGADPERFLGELRKILVSEPGASATAPTTGP